ncbi:MAG: GntR family transcriptional regulator, partial [Marinibacterium sp.]
GPREAAALNIAPGSPVCVHDGLSLVDGRPVALFQSFFPLERLPEIERALKSTSSVTVALKACGVSDYTRSSTRISAEAATPIQALNLQVSEGAPILRTQSVNVDPTGTPVEFGRTWFAGDRVTLTVGDT